VRRWAHRSGYLLDTRVTVSAVFTPRVVIRASRRLERRRRIVRPRNNSDTNSQRNSNSRMAPVKWPMNKFAAVRVSTGEERRHRQVSGSLVSDSDAGTGV
jgi:hypothetical protein